MLAAALATDDLRRLVSQFAELRTAGDAAEAIERVRLFEELKGAIAAAQMRESVALSDERRAADAARGLPRERQGQGVANEVGLARRVSPFQARRFVGLARVLHAEMPCTFAQLTAGRTSEWRAMIMARETVFLSREQRALVDAELGPRLEQLGDGGVEAEARRMAQRLDPAGAAERARRAARERRATVRPAPDTMSRLSILLPVHQGVAAWAALRKHADTLIGIGKQGANPDGTVRTRDQVMADTAVERLTGQVAADDVPIETHLVMTDQTLFHGGDEPGLLLGYGSIAAPLARGLALGGKNSKAKRWVRRLFLTPDRTQLAAMDSRRREFTENQSLFIRLREHDTCRTPWCDAPVRHIDHITDHARGGPTSVANGQGYCAACNYAKQAAGWRTAAGDDGVITTITPTGHRYLSHPPAPPGAQHHPSVLETRLREHLTSAAA